MADVALYFDDSGFGGTAGSEDGWAAVANWQAGLSDGDYPTLSHLIENGWEDDLPGLETDIQSALKDDSLSLGAGKASLEEFLSVLQDRAESDKAVAITLNEETEASPTAGDPLPADNAKGGKGGKGMPSKQAEVDPEKACILPGQEIQGRVVVASKARYSGKAVRITVVSGVGLTVTSNHPILTSEGFVAAGNLRKGQYLLHYVGEDEPGADDVQYAPALAEEIFETMAAFGAETGQVRDLDFHGDGAFFNGEVEIVRANGSLGGDGVADATQVLSQGSLRGEGEGKTLLASGSRPSKVVGALALPSPCLMSGTDNRSPFRFSHPIPLNPVGIGVVTQDSCSAEFAVDDSFTDSMLDGQLFGGFTSQVVLDDGTNKALLQADTITGMEGVSYFGPGAELDVSQSEPSTNGSGEDVVLARQLCDCFPGKVFRDEVVKVDAFHYSGPVYDFQSPLGYILAERLVIGNCKIVKDGGVHDAAGKWRPLTQAQRGMFGALCGQAKGKKPTTHEEADLLRNAVSEVWNEQEVEEPTEIVDGTPLEESLTAEDIVAMYDASSQVPNRTNEEHVLALASVAERINGAARHPETGQFTSPEPIKESKPSKSPHLGEHSSTAYEATKKVKPGKGPASDSISYSTAAYGHAVSGDHVSAAKAHRKAATAHSKAYSNLREDNTERALHKAAENLHRAAARAHALLAGGPAANGEFTDTWADESDPLYGLTPEEVRDSLAELCGRQVTESVRESAILF
jgi:intein/homing endonuclease